MDQKPRRVVPGHEAGALLTTCSSSFRPYLNHSTPDASRLVGLGYALLQQHGGIWKFIQCGSRFLSDVETRYVVIELELVAVVWAFKKCKMYLLGLPHFQLVVDHEPLVFILNDRTLDTIENPRIQRLKERIE